MFLNLSKGLFPFFLLKVKLELLSVSSAVSDISCASYFMKPQRGDVNGQNTNDALPTRLAPGTGPQNRES